MFCAFSLSQLSSLFVLQGVPVLAKRKYFCSASCSYRRYCSIRVYLFFVSLFRDPKYLVWNKAAEFGKTGTSQSVPYKRL